MIKFKDYVYLKQKNEILEFFRNEKLDASEYDIDFLIESNRWKRLLMAGLAAGAVSLPFFLKNNKPDKEVKNTTQNSNAEEDMGPPDPDYLRSGIKIYPNHPKLRDLKKGKTFPNKYGTPYVVPPGHGLEK